MGASLHFVFALTVGATLALASAAWAGETQCWYDNGAVVVAASFGDIAGDFIIDASAPKSLLLEDRANADGVETPTAVRDLVLAGEHVAGFEMPLTNLNERAVGFPTTINGVLGWDLLKRFKVQIQVSPCRLTLSRGAGGRRQPGAVRLALRQIDGAAAVSAVASDGTRSRGGFFSVDTASMGSRFSPADTSFSPPLAHRIDPTWRFKLPARIRAITLGGLLFENTPAGVTPAPPATLSGAIGLAVWSRYRMTLDGRRGWLDLAPPDPEPPNAKPAEP